MGLVGFICEGNGAIFPSPAPYPTPYPKLIMVAGAFFIHHVGSRFICEGNGVIFLSFSCGILGFLFLDVKSGLMVL